MTANPEFQSREPGFIIGWYNQTLGASRWFDLKAVAPEEAAMLLCGFNPEVDCTAHENTHTDQTTPSDFKHLKRALEDIGGDGNPRTLSDWLELTKDRNFKYHNWIDLYLLAIAEKTKSADTGPLPKKPGPICSSQELIDAFGLPNKKWARILQRPTRDGQRYAEALAMKGKRGATKGGQYQPTQWNALIFAVLLIKHGVLSASQVAAKFKRHWPQWQDELDAEIGDLPHSWNC